MGTTSSDVEASGVLRKDLEFNGRAPSRQVAFLLSVGALAAEAADAGESLHVGLLLPDESFAAVFVALGAQVRRAQVRPLSAGEDAARHFETIAALPEGSPVWMVDHGRKYRAFFVGVSTGGDGEPRLNLRRESARGGGLVVGLRRQRAPDVLPADDSTWADLPMTQAGTQLRGSAELVEAVYGSEVNAVMTGCRTDAIIVGRRQAVVDELELQVSCTAGVGRLADLLRLKEAGFASSHRCRWMSSGARELAEAAIGEHRPVSVLNGATNHLDAFFRVQGGVSVSVVGATEPSAPEAVADLQSALYLGTHRPDGLSVDVRMPAGVSAFAMRGAQ
jgi:hypothetical protein